MTPKEKATELYNKMYAINEDDFISEYVSKATALIAVDEIINECFDRFLFSKCDYWQEVKQEIEKL
jgi:hypothetical protein